MGLALALLFGGSSRVAADCAQLAAYYLSAFSGQRMESMEADDMLINPCTNRRELAVMEFKPGYGFVAIFGSGDVHGEVDPYVATLCDDGRAMLRDAAKPALICDTR